MPPAPEFPLPKAGRIWRFGDDVDTDAMAPGTYMKAGIDVLAQHCLASLRPEFPASVRPGDLVVAGSNFGMGSSREQAPQALRHLGVAAVIAPSRSSVARASGWRTARTWRASRCRTSCARCYGRVGWCRT